MPDVSKPHSRAIEMAKYAVERTHGYDSPDKIMGQALLDLVEQLEAAQEAAQKNWDEHSERQLAALDRDPERELRRVKEQLETSQAALRRCERWLRQHPDSAPLGLYGQITDVLTPNPAMAPLDLGGFAAATDPLAAKVFESGEEFLAALEDEAHDAPPPASEPGRPRPRFPLFASGDPDNSAKAEAHFGGGSNQDTEHP